MQHRPDQPCRTLFPVTLSSFQCHLRLPVGIRAEPESPLPCALKPADRTPTPHTGVTRHAMPPCTDKKDKKRLFRTTTACKCGSTTHLRISHRDCPLNPQKRKRIADNSNIPACPRTEPNPEAERLHRRHQRLLLDHRHSQVAGGHAERQESPGGWRPVARPGNAMGFKLRFARRSASMKLHGIYL